MRKKDIKLFFAAGCIFLSSIFFLVGILPLLQVAFGTRESYTRPMVLLLIAIPTGTLGFYLTGAAKTAWLQLPHQAAAIGGVCAMFYGGLQILSGSLTLSSCAFIIGGLLVLLSWRYCSKHNIYKA